MFRKSPKHPQIDLLSSTGQHLDVHLAPADCSDTDLLGPAIEQRTGRHVDTCYADGAYHRSLEKEEQAGPGACGDGIEWYSGRHLAV